MAEIFNITGMDCADCAKTIERGVAKLDGVTACSLNYMAATLNVAGSSREKVIERVRALGYGVAAPTESEVVACTPQSSWQIFVSRFPSSGVLGFLRFLLARPTTALAVLGAVLVLPSLLFHELLPFLSVRGLWLEATAIAAMLVAGVPIARGAWRTLVVNKEIGINLLMTIAALGAVVIGAYTEAGLVMVLFAIGEALEGYTAERARDSISSLLQVAPNEATLLSGERVQITQLQVGDVIVAKPGERIAMDGRVRSGRSAVNQAPITGESVPMEKQIGADVFAGSINGEGALEITVTHLAQDNTLSRIIRMVQEAQERKAPAERFVDTFAKYYTPLVVVLAALVALVPPLFFGQPFLGAQGWLYRALALLVVACPCALVISTPVSIISAISNAARNGVLIKGGAYLEALASINHVAMDKTGTLTEGKPRVIEIKSIGCTNLINTNPNALCANCDDLLALASAVEQRSEHPLAKAVTALAAQRHMLSNTLVAENVSAIVGKGVSGNVNGRTVVIGSHTYFDLALPHNKTYCNEIDAAAYAGRTPVLVGVDGVYAGYITIADALREGSRTAVANLKRMGIATTLLTGDNTATAEFIAQQVGVAETIANLLPQDKLSWVKNASTSPQAKIAMVGDGINDAPALASATVGIAMGAGTAQAMETADVVLMGNDLSKLPFAFKLAQAAMRTIRANIAFAIGIKVAFLILVLPGWGTMWLAVFADVGASLLVTLNGMRLMRWRER